MTRKLCVKLLLICAALALAGCPQPHERPGMVAVSGRLTKGGEPLHVSGRETATGMVAIEFHPDPPSPTGETFRASADDQGEFVLIDGLPPGKYKVSVRQWDPYPQTDKLNGQFAPERTPIVREVQGDERIEIDLDKL